MLAFFISSSYPRDNRYWNKLSGFIVHSSNNPETKVFFLSSVFSNKKIKLKYLQLRRVTTWDKKQFFFCFIFCFTNENKRDKKKVCAKNIKRDKSPFYEDLMRFSLFCNILCLSFFDDNPTSKQNKRIIQEESGSYLNWNASEEKFAKKRDFFRKAIHPKKLFLCCWQPSKSRNSCPHKEMNTCYCASKYLKSSHMYVHTKKW